jgi:urease accessory protein
MMSCFSIASRIQFKSRPWQVKPLAALLGLSVLLFSRPAFAHHLMGGRVPSNFFEGFLSGLAHPIIGLDHFAFIVSVGLLSATKRRGILVPIAFILAAMVGTGVHLATLTLPGVEFFVAGFILVFGLLLALSNNLDTAMIVGLGAIAGVCHGYAYGESIFGAEMTPLVAYLAGFTGIQLVVSLGSFIMGKALLARSKQELPNGFHAAGWVTCGIGLTFLASQLVGAIFPGF